MAIHRPTQQRLAQIAEQFGLDLSDEDLQTFQKLIHGTVNSYERILQITEPSLPVNSVGMMIIGRCGDDETVLRVAHAFQTMNG
jgi:Asp-tRNA(Asn)/Glu-tRNA(Gln) amidotransferase A subunit family amidase